MAAPKTIQNDASISEFIANVPDATRRADALALLELFKKATGEQPKMWGTSIIGFGSYHYKSERSSQEGDWMLTGFSPRAAAQSLYILNGLEHYQDLLAQLGKHKTGKGCLYITKLSDVDMSVLEELVTKSYKAMKAASITQA